MKIVLEDFNYKGHHVKCSEHELPNVKDIDEIPEGKIEEYIMECLDDSLKEM